MNGILTRTLFASAALAVVLAPAVVRAQTDYDTDGQTIGNLTGDARVGYNTTAWITVYTDANTNVNVNLDVYNNATLDMPAGDYGAFVTAHGASKINMSGGTADFTLTAADGALVTITGGYIGNTVSAMNSGTVVFTGGRAGSDLKGADDSVITLDGGTVTSDVVASDRSAVRVSSGAVGGDLAADDNSLINWTGGDVGGNLFVRSGATFLIHGSNLTATPSGVGNGFNLFTLAGNLTDGTDIAGKVLEVADNGQASYQLINGSGPTPDVPEPGTVAFGIVAAGGILGMIARKRRRGAGVVSAVAALIIVGASAANAQTTSFNNDGDVIGTIVGDAIIGDAPVNPPITVYANGATIVLGGVVVENDSIFEMDGGVVSDIFANGTSVVNVRGGKVGDLFAFNSSQYCLFGSGLSATLIDPNYGQFVKYSLSGHLSDGGDLAQTSLYIDSGSVATFKLVEVPEPSAVAFGILAAGGVLGMIARKRKA